jgi:hypothetical protein
LEGDVDGRLGLGIGMGMGMSGPTTASGEKRCVPTSEEVAAWEKEEVEDISADELDELEVEKSMSRACGVGVGGEEVEREEREGRCRFGTERDLLLLWGIDRGLDLS